jgi:hypothetical protein
VRACLLSASLLYCAISCNGTQGHGGEEGTQKGKKNDEECLPHSSISHNVEEAQKDEHTPHVFAGGYEYSAVGAQAAPAHISIQSTTSTAISG